VYDNTPKEALDLKHQVAAEKNVHACACNEAADRTLALTSGRHKWTLQRDFVIS
jgi:hypothetical protein